LRIADARGHWGAGCGFSCSTFYRGSLTIFRSTDSFADASEHPDKPIFSDMNAMAARAAGRRKSWQEARVCNAGPSTSSRYSAVIRPRGRIFRSIPVINAGIINVQAI